MIKLKKFAALLTMLAIGLSATGAASAADACAGRVIRMIIANPAGGVGDVIARLVAEKASTELGQPIIIENHPGATTMIGTDLVAKSKPDGCTILSLTASGVVLSVLRDKMPYNLTRDFAPIASIGSLPMVLAVPVASKLNSFADLAAAIKSSNGITYASGGAGTLAHLSAVRLIKDMNGSGNHVPYKGNSDAMQGLLGNHVQLFFPGISEALPLAKAGKILLLGVTSEQRIPLIPDVPTMKELGFAEFNPKLWYGFLAPAATPPESVSRLRDAISKAALDPAVKERLAALGFTTEIKDSAGLAAYMKSEATRWGKVIKDNNITSGD